MVTDDDKPHRLGSNRKRMRGFSWAVLARTSDFTQLAAIAPALGPLARHPQTRRRGGSAPCEIPRARSRIARIAQSQAHSTETHVARAFGFQRRAPTRPQFPALLARRPGGVRRRRPSGP